MLDVDDLPADLSIPEVSHVAFVVNDLDAGMRRFGRIFGTEPWFTYRYEAPRLQDLTYRGEPASYSMRVAITDVGGPVDLLSRVVPSKTLARIFGRITAIRDRLFGGPLDGGTMPGRLPNPGLPGVNLELIEPLDGPSTYTADEWGRTGVHHLGCFAYDNPRDAVDRFERAGFPVVQSGVFEGVEFWYLDLSSVLEGVLFEIAGNLWRIPAPDGVYPEP